MTINQRKADHIRVSLEEDVTFSNLTAGLEQFHFVHQALPEMAFGDVDTTISLFGKKLAAPILVSSMTGGTGEAEQINRNLAEAAQTCNVAMGVGSQRIGIERAEVRGSFQVRHFAPDVLLFANLGAVQFNYGYGVDQCRRAVEMIDADALILHLNPLQEVLQAEGDFDWHGLLTKIEQVCRQLEKPVIAKEVGWGMSSRVAKMLIEAGVSAIDVAGSGGTSWSQVEMYRAPTARLQRLAGAFRNWGIPTVESLLAVCRVRDELGKSALPVFASGGIRTGQDIAKCLALGADLVGLASPFLKRAVESTEAVVEEMSLLQDEVRIAMFCSESKDIQALRRPGVLVERQAMRYNI